MISRMRKYPKTTVTTILGLPSMDISASARTPGRLSLHLDPARTITAIRVVASDSRAGLPLAVLCLDTPELNLLPYETNKALKLPESLQGRLLGPPLERPQQPKRIDRAPLVPLYTLRTMLYVPPKSAGRALTCFQLGNIKELDVGNFPFFEKCKSDFMGHHSEKPCGVMRGLPVGGLGAWYTKHVASLLKKFSFEELVAYRNLLPRGSPPGHPTEADEWPAEAQFSVRDPKYSAYVRALYDPASLTSQQRLVVAAIYDINLEQHSNALQLIRRKLALRGVMESLDLAVVLLHTHDLGADAASLASQGYWSRGSFSMTVEVDYGNSVPPAAQRLRAGGA